MDGRKGSGGSAASGVSKLDCTGIRPGPDGARARCRGGLPGSGDCIMGRAGEKMVPSCSTRYRKEEKSRADVANMRCITKASRYEVLCLREGLQMKCKSGKH